MDPVVAARRGNRTFAVLFASVAFLLSVLTFGAQPARAASSIDSVAAALKDKPVYVDPDAPVQLSSSQIDSLVSQINGMRSGVPVFLAVLPDNPTFHQNTIFQQLDNKIGKDGVIGVSLGTRFKAQDFSGDLRRGQADNLAAAAATGSGGDLETVLSTFISSTDSAILADGRVKPKSTSNSGGGAVGVLIGVAVLAAAGGGAFLVVNNRKKKRAQARRDAELAGLKKAVDEDITAYGEVLDELDFSPTDPRATDDMRRDYSKALDQYEAAKQAAAAAKRPEDMKNVTEALEDGRFALATLDARRKGTPLPERRPPCFFDPRHGPSVGDVTWAPPGGAARAVPACAMDMTRVSDGLQPQVRHVDTAYGPQPYYNAGPAYGPWAGGYFGGDVLGAVMVGTLMGSMLGGFGGWGGGTYIENNYYGDGGGPDGGWGDGGGGGDAGGDGGGWGDFGGSADWGGGDSGGGDWGGGDSGGGDWGGGGGDWGGGGGDW
jgi:hypothetical protein